MDVKKKILIALMIVAIGIWGYNLYQFRQGTDNTPAMAAIPTDGTAKPVGHGIIPVKNTFIYTADTRDPFEHRLYPKKKIIKKDVIKQEPLKPEVKKAVPRLTLQGTLGGNDNIRAIILDERGTTHISKTGDEIMGVKIVGISKRHVKGMFEDEDVIFEIKKR